MITVLDASRALLIEVAQILNEQSCNYVIVGGWSPYLRNNTTHAHPGTKDVDVLFSDAHARGGISAIVDSFLDRGFLVSAKHDFQLLKEVEVSGKKLVFNIDLLHPSETIDNPELFVDHFDLGIKESDFGDDKLVRSIVLPSSQLLFKRGMWSAMPVTCQLTGRTLDVPLITEAGCLLSKCGSVGLAKRKRDAFDIFLSVKSAGVVRIAETIRPYAHINGVRELLTSLRKFLAEPCCVDGSFLEFDTRVLRYAREASDEGLPSGLVLNVLDAIMR